MAVTKAIKAAIDEMSRISNQGKYAHRVFIVDNICSFLNTEKGQFMELQKEIDTVRNSLGKFVKDEPEKVKLSDLELLRDISESIYDLFKEKSL